MLKIEGRVRRCMGCHRSERVSCDRTCPSCVPDLVTEKTLLEKFVNNV